MRPRRWTRNRVLLMLSIAAFLLVLAVFKFSAPRTVVLNWDYNYAHDPPCTSRLADNCVTGFRVFVGDPSDRSQQLFVANPVDAVGNPASQRVGTAFKVNRFGYLQFCVLAVKKGQSMPTVEGAPICMKRLVLPFGLGSNWTR